MPQIKNTVDGLNIMIDKSLSNDLDVVDADVKAIIKPLEDLAKGQGYLSSRSNSDSQDIYSNNAQIANRGPRFSFSKTGQISYKK